MQLTTSKWKGPLHKGRVSFALVDQLLFSLSGLAINLLLARYLPIAQYGAYSVAFAVFLFLSGFYNALVLEPLTIVGSTWSKSTFAEYLSRVANLHFVLTGAMAIVVLAAARSIFAGNQLLSSSITAVAVLTPLLLAFWTYRRVFHVTHRPSLAVLTTLIYAGVLGSVLLLIVRLDRISVIYGFGAMMLASLAACVALWPKLEINVRSLGIPLADALIRQVAKEHWDYGKWIVATALLTVGVNYIQTFLAAGLIGLDAAGTLRALQLLTFPVNQLVIGIGLFALPQLAKRAVLGVDSDFRRTGLSITLALGTFALVYELVLLLLYESIEQIVYQGRYSYDAFLIPILGLASVFGAVTNGFSFILRAARMPKHYLIQSGITAPVGIITTLLLARQFGLTGVAVSVVLTSAVSALTIYTLYHRWISSKI